MENMKAIFKQRREYDGTELRRVPIPKPGPNEVLVKVDKVSICGTDLHIYMWNKWAQNRIHNVPQIMGHELAGTVVEIGKNVTAVKVGDFVSAETHIPCGHCKQCRSGKMHICQNLKILGVDTNGAFAEYIVVPEVVVWKNDPAIPKEWASIQEPLGNAVFTVLRNDVSGRSLVIFGDGPIGLLSAAVAVASGAGPVTLVGLSKYRLNIAKKLNVDYVLDASEVDVVKECKKITNGDGFDVSIEASGAEIALRQALEVLTPGGRISLIGLFEDDIKLNLNDLVIFKAASVYGITGREMFKTWEKVANFLKTKRLNLDPIITHQFKLEDYQKGFELMEKKECGKILLIP